jgi:hypothetical protein
MLPDEPCLCPNQLARELDAELRRHGIILPSLISEFTMDTGPQVHLGVTSVECAQDLLELLRQHP